MITNNLSFNEGKYITFEEQKYKYIITSNTKEQYNSYKNISELMECENTIKEKYQLSNDDSLYLLMIVNSSKEISYIETEYEIYYFYDKLYIQDICNFTIKEYIINDTKTSNNIIITNNEYVEQSTIQQRENKTCKPIYNDSSEVNITNLNEVLDDILKDIKNEITSGNFNLTNINKGEDIIIEENGTKFIVTTTDNQKDNIGNKNMTIINLNRCETELRKKYNISGNIYILKVEKEQEG